MPVTIFLMVGLVVGAPVAEAASEGAVPVIHYMFNEQGGGTAYDETAPAANGTLDAGTLGTNTAAGQMWTRVGKLGGAMKFDGTDDHLSATDTTFLRQGNNWTVAAWIKFKNPDPGADSDRIIVGKTGWHGGLLRLSGQVQFSITNTVGTRWYVAYTPTVDVWYHYEGVYTSSTGNMNLYVNGVSVGTATFNTATTMNYEANSTLYVGGVGTDAYHTFAEVDDVRIYNYLRTAEQVLLDYNAGAAAHLGAGADPNEFDANASNKLVGYWPLDDNTLTTALDKSGSGYDGTLTNGPTWAQGKNGSAIQLDGTNDYVNIASTGIGNFTNGSIAVWIYPTSLSAAATCNSHNGSTSCKAIAFSDDYGYFFGLNSDGALVLDLGSGAGWSVVNNTAASLITTNAWQHVAVTVAGTTVKYYVNGVLRQTNTVAANSGLKLGSNNRLGLGGAALSPTNYPFTGRLDDVRLYNYARSDAQVAYDYNRGKPVAHYKFDEGTGKIAHSEASTADTGTAPVGWWRMDTASSGAANAASVTDESGNTNTGTADDGANNTGMTWTAGKIGPGGLDFDGVDDVVTIGNAAPLNTDFTAFTLQCWMYADAVTGGDAQIIGKGTNVYGMTYHTDGKVWFYITSGGNYLATTVGTGAWHHVVGTFDGTTKKFYLDGVLVNSGASSSSSTGTGGTFQIGGSTSDFDGKIDDVRMYNYARTAEQVYNDYKTTHGTLVGNTTFVDGKMGKALTLDGTGDYVHATSGSQTGLNFTNALTFEAWYYANSLSNFNVLLSQGSWIRYIRLYGGQYQIGLAGLDDYNIGTFTITGAWVHLAVTYDGSTIRVYENGQLDGSSSTTGTWTYAAANLFIGQESNATHEWNGKIDDVRIYNYKRDDAQILQDYNAGGTARLGTQAAGEADPWGGALPINHWKLDDNTGVLARDASGNGKDGTLTGGPTWTQGKYGSAVSFDGSDDYVSVGNLGSFYTAGSISFWMNASEMANYRNPLTTKRAGGNVGIRFEENASGNFGVIVGNDAGTYAVGTYLSGGMLTNRWYHVALVWDTVANNVKGYWDGVQVFNQSHTLWPTTLPDLAIGTGFTTDAARQWKGYVDDVRLYNYARTAAQIAWDYNRGKPVAHYRFNEGSGTTAYDEAKTSNGTITIGGLGSQTTIGAAWTAGATGKFGKAMSFDGTDDGVTATFGYGVLKQGSETASFTIAAWVKPNTQSGGERVIAGRNGCHGGLTANASNEFHFQLAATDCWISGIDLSSGAVSGFTNWHHVVGVYDNRAMKLYVDGVLKSSGTFSATMRAYDDTFYMGSIGTYAFNGLIDDVRVYTYARSAEQVLQDYLNGAAARLGD